VKEEERKNARPSLGVQSVLERISQFPVVVYDHMSVRQVQDVRNVSWSHLMIMAFQKVKPRSRHDPDHIKVTSRTGYRAHHAWDRWRTIADLSSVTGARDTFLEVIDSCASGLV